VRKEGSTSIKLRGEKRGGNHLPLKKKSGGRKEERVAHNEPAENSSGKDQLEREKAESGGGKRRRGGAFFRVEKSVGRKLNSREKSSCRLCYTFQPPNPKKPGVIAGRGGRHQLEKRTVSRD